MERSSSAYHDPIVAQSAVHDLERWLTPVGQLMRQSADFRSASSTFVRWQTESTICSRFDVNTKFRCSPPRRSVLDADSVRFCHLRSDRLGVVDRSRPLITSESWTLSINHSGVTIVCLRVTRCTNTNVLAYVHNCSNVLHENDLQCIASNAVCVT